jgi:hypothetical protein
MIGTGKINPENSISTQNALFERIFGKARRIERGSSSKQIVVARDEVQEEGWEVLVCVECM